MFAWTMKEGVVLPRGNPAAFTNKRLEKPRDRVLSDDELRLIWRALDNDDYGRIIKLLILTGDRAEEIAGLRWGEVSDNAINLPGSRTKNKRGHTIPLQIDSRSHSTTIRVWASTAASQKLAQLTAKSRLQPGLDSAEQPEPHLVVIVC
jgi:integrase